MKTNIKTLSPGMRALQHRVAAKILNDKRRSHVGKKNSLLIKMHSAFKLELSRHAALEGRSMTNYLLVAAAERMQYKGDI